MTAIDQPDNRSDDKPADSPTPNVYTISNPLGYFAIAIPIGVIGIVVLVGIATSNNMSPALLFMGLLGLAAAVGGLFLIYNFAVTRLTISAAGLVYRDASGTTTAAWDEVLEIRTGSIERHGSYTNLVLTGDHRAIEVGQFGGVEPDSPLGQDLRTYAPRLFSAEDDHAANP